MPTAFPLPVEPLDMDRCAPYGWMLGKPVSRCDEGPAFTSPASDFWREHLFETGAPGETEVLWVVYRSDDATVASLERHHLTQQAIVPLTAPVVHVVATSKDDGSPDLATLRAFGIAPGQGLCMRAKTWHATRVRGGEATCLMLTRPSTTIDLVVHLKTGAPACESVLQPIGARRREWATEA